MGFLLAPVNIETVRKIATTINQLVSQHRESLRTVFQVYVNEHLSTMCGEEYYQLLEDLDIIREFGITRDDVNVIFEQVHHTGGGGQQHVMAQGPSLSPKHRPHGFEWDAPLFHDLDIGEFLQVFQDNIKCDWGDGG
jgi:hypothetical protein